MLCFRAIPHNSKCRYGERGAAAAKPKAQIILCVLLSILATRMPCRTPSRSEALRSATAACGGSWRGDPPERCLSRKAGIMRCCPKSANAARSRELAGSPPSSGPAGRPSVFALRAACGSCASTRACGCSPEGELIFPLLRAAPKCGIIALIVLCEIMPQWDGRRARHRE